MSNAWDFERWLTTRGLTNAPLENPNPAATPAQHLAILNGWKMGRQDNKRVPFSYQACLGMTRELARREIRRVRKEKNRNALTNQCWEKKRLEATQ